MNDLITIIVPIYKVEKYISKCINSIINQTYKNLEIILVDDGSPDRCPDICDEFAKKDKRIKVIHKENGGLSDARNKGIDISNGRYLIFIDSDDYVDEKMVEKLYTTAKKENCDIVVCNYYLVDEKSTKIKKRAKLKKDIEISNDNNKYDFLYNDYKMLSVTAWNKIYKKELFDDIRYPKGKINEDEFIICDLLKKSHKIAYINDSLYYYLQRKNSIIHTFNMKRFDILDSIKNREVFFLKIGDIENYYNTMLLEYILILNLMSDFYKSGFYDKKIEEEKTNRLFFLRKNLKKHRIKHICSKDKIRLLYPRMYMSLKSKKIIR